MATSSSTDSTYQKYYAERLPVVMDRWTILALVEIIAWALEQPGCVGPTATLLREILRQFIPLVQQYQPAEVLHRWDRLQRGAADG